MAGRDQCACALLAAPFSTCTLVLSHWVGAADAQGVSALLCQSSGDALTDTPQSTLHQFSR